MGKKNNSYTASYKLKVISFAERFGNRAAQRELGILESNVRYWKKPKELLKMQKVTVGHFVVRNWKICVFHAPKFFSGQTRKKNVRKLRE
jgi:hypothetical protein